MAIQTINLENFNSITQSERPVLVEFWAPWCVYCRRIAPALQMAAEQYGDRLTVAQVNIDEAPQLAEQHRIDLVPTFLLFQNKHVLGSLTAPDSKAKIDEFLQAHLRK